MAETASRISLSQAAVSIVTAVAVWLTVGVSSPLPAHAEDPVDPVTIPVTGFEQGIVIEGDFTLTLPVGPGETQVPSQCAPVSQVPGMPPSSTGGTLCIGGPTVELEQPLEVRDAADAYPVLKQEKARTALDWMVDEAVQTIRLTHDVPDDARILRHARPEIRAHIIVRLLDILDRYTYGVPLTADEERALEFLEAELGVEHRARAEAAYAEFRRWQDQRCSYSPPPAPSSVTQPLGLPKNVRDWCAVRHAPLGEAFMFAPPIPSAGHFTTWGSYRSSTANGVDDLGNPQLQENIRNTIAATAVLTGAIGAGLGAAGAAAIVGTSSSLAFGAAAMMGSASATVPALTSIAPGLSTAFLGTGVLAAASLVAVVVMAVVVTAVAIYQLVEHESVGTTLQQRRDSARSSTDPMLLEPLRKVFSGKPLRSELDPDSPPPYRSGEALKTLVHHVTRWSTVTDSGFKVGDPSSVRSGSGPTADDPKFWVRTGTQARKVVNKVTVPQVEGEPLTLNFSDGWLVGSRPGERARLMLSFGYEAVNGNAMMAMRNPAEEGGFLVSADEGGVLVGKHLDRLTFKNQDGVMVRVGLTDDFHDQLAGPRPSVVGPLIAGRHAMLRPNPVNIDGTMTDPQEAEEDFTYHWEISRLDQVTGDWQPVKAADTFGTSFVPTEPGEYDARVTMTSRLDSSQRHGQVAFTINPPPITTPVLQLLDDGSHELELDLQMVEEVPSDRVTVEVRWPRKLGEAEPDTTRLEQDCHQTGPLECTTPRTTGAAPLRHSLTPASDLREPVVVTLTNSYGAVLTKTLRIDHPGRPGFAPPEPSVNDDEPGSVTLGEEAVQLTMPLSQDNSDYQIAQLVPGTGSGDDFGLVDPMTGNTAANIYLPGVDNVYASVDEDPSGTWSLYVWGNPKRSELGSYEVPVVIQQTNGNRSLILVVVHVVPSTGDRFRGALDTDLEGSLPSTERLPNIAPVVLGGTAKGKQYDGGMCLSLQLRDFGDPPVEKCGPVAMFRDADGNMVGFPFSEFFPDGMRSGIYEAQVWLTDEDPDVDRTPLGAAFFLSEDANVPVRHVDIGKPEVRGKAKVGRTLRAVVPWVDPDNARLKYRWLRDGVVIKGERGRQYEIGRIDRGDRLSVKVIATKRDWVRVSRVSEETRKVRRR